jgi:hypothetical protein
MKKIRVLFGRIRYYFNCTSRNENCQIGDVHKKYFLWVSWKSALWMRYCTLIKGDANELLSLRASLFLGCYTVYVVIVYRRFGNAYRSYFHGSSNLELHGIPKEWQPQIHRGWRLKPRIPTLLVTFTVQFWWNGVLHTAHNAVKQSRLLWKSGPERSYFICERTWKYMYESNANRHASLDSKERLRCLCTTSRPTPYVFFFLILAGNIIFISDRHNNHCSLIVVCLLKWRTNPPSLIIRTLGIAIIHYYSHRPSHRRNGTAQIVCCGYSLLLYVCCETNPV